MRRWQLFLGYFLLLLRQCQNQNVLYLCYGWAKRFVPASIKKASRTTIDSIYSFHGFYIKKNPLKPLASLAVAATKQDKLFSNFSNIRKQVPDDGGLYHSGWCPAWPPRLITHVWKQPCTTGPVLVNLACAAMMKEAAWNLEAVVRIHFLTSGKVFELHRYGRGHGRSHPGTAARI